MQCNWVYINHTLISQCSIFAWPPHEEQSGKKSQEVEKWNSGSKQPQFCARFPLQMSQKKWQGEVPSDLQFPSTPRHRIWGKQASNPCYVMLTYVVKSLVLLLGFKMSRLAHRHALVWKAKKNTQSGRLSEQCVTRSLKYVTINGDIIFMVQS